jgi:superfamily II DNA or RNA helicase
MSILVDGKSLGSKTAKQVEKDLRVVSLDKPGVPKRFQKKVVITAYKVLDDDDDYGRTGVMLPFYYARNVLEKVPRGFDGGLATTHGGHGVLDNGKIERRGERLTFTGELTKVQKGAKKETLKLLNQNCSCLISFQCGLGKTVYSLYLAGKIGLTTMILVHRITLISQWERAIRKFIPNARLEVCGAKNPPSGKSDFYIMNMINVPKLSTKQYEFIDVLIVDEVHVACAETMSKCLFFINPLYGIGLSATPKRSDGLDKLLDLYFGPERIIRIVNIPHTVYSLQTGIIPEAQENSAGGVDWNSVIKSQSENQERNDLIVRLVQHFPDRTWLILCKRKYQAKYLTDQLTSKSENVTCIMGTQQTFDLSARIVVSTYSKTGVGFDHPNLNGLILASDVDEGIEQYHGRVFRREDSQPIIIDILDDFPSFQKHWNNRKRFYKERKGKIEIFTEKFPDFLL